MADWQIEPAARQSSYYPSWHPDTPVTDRATRAGGPRDGVAAVLPCLADVVVPDLDDPVLHHDGAA